MKIFTSNYKKTLLFLLTASTIVLFIINIDLFHKWKYEEYNSGKQPHKFGFIDKVKTQIYTNIFYCHLRSQLKKQVNVRFWNKLSIPTTNMAVLHVGSKSLGECYYFYVPEDKEQYNSIIDLGEVRKSPINEVFSYFINYEYYLKKDSAYSLMVLPSDFNYAFIVHNGSFVGMFPHTDVIGQGTAAYNKIKVVFRIPPDKYYPNEDSVIVNYNGIHITTGDGFFRYWRNSRTVAESMVESSINLLHSSDSTFRNFLHEPILSELVKNIKLKSKRAIDDDSFKYPINERREDVNRLYKKAKDLGFSVDYTNEVMSLPENQPRAGNLIWFYESIVGFNFQWLLIDLVFILMLFVIKLKNVKWLEDRKILFPLLLTYNGYIFYIRPIAPLYNFILPGLIFVFLYYLTNRMYQEKVHKK